MDNQAGGSFQRCTIFYLLALVALLAGFCSSVIANETKTIEKRSCIQSVDGYSYLSEDKTVAELRTAAFNNAKQQALTNAKTYIKSKTEVDNFVLKSDNVLTASEGTVTVLEEKDFGIKDNSRYHVWIKAEVEYLLGEGGSSEKFNGQSVLSDQSDQNPGSAKGPLTVKIWSPKKTYKAGERIEIFVKGNRDFYARIVNINPKGTIVQLLPNSFRTSSLFQGGKIYKIPETGDQFDLTVSPPFGEDMIIVYASEVPLGQVAMQNIGNGLSAFSGDQKSFASSTRGISVAGKNTGKKKKQIAEFFEATYEILTSI